jgi:hypothetical protein
MAESDPRFLQEKCFIWCFYQYNQKIMINEGQSHEIESDGGTSYYRITDESTPNPINEAILFLKENKVITIWTIRKLGNDYIQIKDGFLFSKPDEIVNIQDLKKKLIQILEYSE